MKKQIIGSAGGKATAIILRMKSLALYYANPNYCQECNKIIEVGARKVAEVRKKKFCNHSCAAVSTNKKFIKKKSLLFLKSKDPKKDIRGRKINYSKKELKNRSQNWWRHRIPIARDARKEFTHAGKEKKCYNCGYDKHIEVCHKKAVSNFSDDSKLSEINALDNLIALCRNCHWEFDNGLLIL